jgi:hypothetical protein
MIKEYLGCVYRIWLYREELPREKADSGLINSLVSFIVASSEAPRSLSKEVAFPSIFICYQ